MLPPPASKYARYPEDQRFVREWLRLNNAGSITALYAGTAYGEDFWSWLNIGIGTNTAVRWTGLELDTAVYQAVSLHAPTGIRMINSNALDHCDDYDLIIANNIWSGDQAANRPMLFHLAQHSRSVLIARGAHMNVPGKIRRGHLNDDCHPLFIAPSVDLAAIERSVYVDLVKP